MSEDEADTRGTTHPNGVPAHTINVECDCPTLPAWQTRSEHKDRWFLEAFAMPCWPLPLFLLD